MQLLDCSVIVDPDIREVYQSDILHLSRRVQAKFGIYPFLYDGPIENMTGFYEFRVFANEKKVISEMRRL